MLQEIANRRGWPSWCSEGTRSRNLAINDLWLEGRFYDHIINPFSKETDSSGNFNKLWDKRPSIRLNLPMLAADVVSRKLFAANHAPVFVHDNDNLASAMKWLCKKAKLYRKMMSASFWGQAGSVAVTLMVDKSVPCVKVWQAKLCHPTFDSVEQLQSLDIAYIVSGNAWLSLGIATDWKDEKILPNESYWYMRRYDELAVWTFRAIKEADWNPEEFGCEDLPIEKSLTEAHTAGFALAHWMNNLEGNWGVVDGRATFQSVLPNCIDIDYTLSQMGRGIKACAAPQLMVKGKIQNDRGGGHVMGPHNMLQLPADRSDPNGVGLSGADAKMLEMTGAGIDIGMEKFVAKIKEWTQEIMSVSRKDPTTMKGAMSGKAMELIDEDFNDLINVMQTTYGDDGILDVGCKLGKILIALGHEKFKGIKPADLEELELDWPRRYTASPQEAGFIVDAVSNAIVNGLWEMEQGQAYMDTQLGSFGDQIEVEHATEANEMLLSTIDDKPNPRLAKKTVAKKPAKAIGDKTTD